MQQTILAVINRRFHAALFTVLLIAFSSGNVHAGKQSQGERVHVVKAGDTVSSIARHYGVAQWDLCSANGIKRDQSLKIGMELSVPDASEGGARRTHVVRAGDTLALVAKKYKVSLNALARANRYKKGHTLSVGRTLVIPKDGEDPYDVARAARKKPSKAAKGKGSSRSSKKRKRKSGPKLISSGKKVPGGVLHTVQKGQTIWHISRAYNVAGDRIRSRNQLTKGDSLKVGQKILVPGADEVVPMRVKGPAILPVHFVRVHNNKRADITLLTRGGKVSKRGRRTLSRLAAANRGKRRVKQIHPRLIRLLQKVADRFPGAEFEIVSGYRPKTRGNESRHGYGRALDFRLRGVSNRELYNFVRKFPGVGAGYYPNSTFIHLDVRKKKYLWTDVSQPGEPSRYVTNFKGKIPKPEPKEEDAGAQESDSSAPSSGGETADAGAAGSEQVLSDAQS